MNKTIISLFDYSGNWSKPYKDNGYNVVQVDIKHGIDIYDWYWQNYIGCHGILAAPPCTDFAGSGARWWKEKDADGRTLESMRLMNRTLALIHMLQPMWWVLENPVGRLNKLFPQLEDYGPRYYQPYWYGDPYSKKTGLWGRFNFPEPTNMVEPEGQRKGQPNAWYSKVGGKSEKTKEYRSITPIGFAQAFYEVNK